MGSSDITIEDEAGQTVSGLPDVSISEVALAIETVDRPTLLGTHCLQFIDRYTDTTFNWLQRKTLLDELELLSHNKIIDHAKLSRIIEFVRTYNEEHHLFLKFHGD